MVETLAGGNPRQELVSVIRRVRARWRTKLLLRGGVIVLAGGLAALILASFGLQTYKFSPTSVVALRIATLTVFALLLLLWLLRPLTRRVNDLQVALYIEEHEPSLQAAILSAVDVGAVSTGGHKAEERSEHVPPLIVERMVAQAVEHARNIGGGKAVGQRALRRHAIALTGLAALAALLLV